VTFHMPSLISGFVSMSDMVAKFLNAKDVPSQLRNFINSWLAEDWVPDSVSVRSTTLDNCKANYKTGESPQACPSIAGLTKEIPFRIFTHGDVQKTGVWCLTQVYWKTGHSAYLGHKFVSTYQEMEDFSKVEYEIDGKKHASNIVSVDCGDGNRTKEIYDVALQMGWVAMKGANRPLPMLFEEKTWNLETGRTGGTGLTVTGLYIDTAAIKHNLVALLNSTQQITTEEHAAGARSIGVQFWLPSDVADTVTNQLTSEQFNRESELWEVKPGKAGSDGNHLFDCAVNIYAVATSYGLTFHRVEEKKDD